MKNIILQHWKGELNELARLSMENISQYAQKCGAEYKLVMGDPFHPNVKGQIQKLCILNEEWDAYDIVVMLDMDMFVRKGMGENIFNVDGLGMTAEYQEGLFKGLCRRFPTWTNPNYPYWGGAIYRMEKDIRKKLRTGIDHKDTVELDRIGKDDELLLHRIATKSGVKEKLKLPGEYKWCHCSYREGIENSAMIHVRTKITPTGPKRTKMENYKDLVSRGLI